MTPRLALNLAAPHTWAASVFPALFADFYCWQQGLGLTWFKGIMLLAACIFLQSAVNTLNDYFDFIKGADSADDHVEVSDAVLIYGNVAPGSALILGIVYMAAGAVLGLASCIGSGMVPIIIGIIGGDSHLFGWSDSRILSSDRRNSVRFCDGRPHPFRDCRLCRRRDSLADTSLFTPNDCGDCIDHDEQ